MYLLLCGCIVLRDLQRVIMKQNAFYRCDLALNIRIMIKKTLQEELFIFYWKIKVNDYEIDSFKMVSFTLKEK